MTPLSALMHMKQALGPRRSSRTTICTATSSSTAAPRPGHGSGEAIQAMEQIAQKVMPAGVSYEWSGLQLDEIAAGRLSDR